MKLILGTMIAFFLIIMVCISAGEARAAEADKKSQTIARAGSQPSSKGSADYFTGTVRVDPLFSATDTAPFSGAYVTFAPGTRSAWHIHPTGQRLLVTAGTGRTQEWGGPVEEIRAGDVIVCPPGVKHWHGASPTSTMTHIAITGTVNGTNVQWLEKVTDEQYNPLPSSLKGGPTMTKEPSAAEKMIGDIAPKLADLTDTVLFGDVWERPELSKRDRSLITVAALVAMNRPEQLKHHLDRAQDNGVTRAELIETITHLALYSGWPNAMTAIMTAKEQFAKREANE